MLQNRSLMPRLIQTVAKSCELPPTGQPTEPGCENLDQAAWAQPCNIWRKIHALAEFFGPTYPNLRSTLVSPFLAHFSDTSGRSTINVTGLPLLVSPKKLLCRAVIEALGNALIPGPIGRVGKAPEKSTFTPPPASSRSRRIGFFKRSGFLSMGETMPLNSIKSRIGKSQGPAVGGRLWQQQTGLFCPPMCQDRPQARPDGARLGEIQEPIEMQIHWTSGVDPERTDKLPGRLGYRTYGGNYVSNTG